jgi:1-acyl-sn-glycerol-3-phosphate acyltransferase
MLLPISNPLVQGWFDWYCGFALRKHFHRVQLFGDAVFEPERSTLYLVNHCSFWDGIVMNFLIRRYRRQKAYCMSDLAQIKKHPFFRRVGAFSVDRTSPRDGMRAIQFAADLLNTPPCAVVIFPQGKIEPANRRPMLFQRGIERIIERAPSAQVVLVAIRYEFWLNQRPEILLDLCVAKHRTATGLAEQMTIQLDRLSKAGLGFETGPRILLTGRRSIGGDD